MSVYANGTLIANTTNALTLQNNGIHCLVGAMNGSFDGWVWNVMIRSASTDGANFTPVTDVEEYRNTTAALYLPATAVEGDFGRDPATGDLYAVTSIDANRDAVWERFIPLSKIQTETAAATDFADYQARIAAI